jgi:hypothetical protein
MAWGGVMNVIAVRIASALEHASPDQRSPDAVRPAGMVYDYVPLVHLDTRLIGYQDRRPARLVNNSAACSRHALPSILPGRVSAWTVFADEVARRGITSAWAKVDREGLSVIGASARTAQQ